ncbi:unnamed protein product, partial [Discosporangium mesarthrocarpum]
GGVRKLLLTHPEEGLLGTIYLDLYRREGKYAQAAHFTVRCGCAINPSGLAGLQYQLPTVVLVCNFALPKAPGSPSPSASTQGQKGGARGGGGGRGGGEAHRLLSHSEAETLFHEFGHALHSLLSRTELQHVS